MERFDSSGDNGYDIDIRRYDKVLFILTLSPFFSSFPLLDPPTHVSSLYSGKEIHSVPRGWRSEMCDHQSNTDHA